MPEKLRLSLCRTFEFAAAHRLFRPEWTEERNTATFGKCASPHGHGHNYRLDVSISGELEPVTGMVVHTSVLRQLVEEVVINDVDHKNLDIEVPWLHGKTSSVENIIAAIWERLAPAISSACNTSRLEKLVLWESDRLFATLERE